MKRRYIYLALIIITLLSFIVLGINRLNSKTEVVFSRSVKSLINLEKADSKEFSPNYQKKLIDLGKKLKDEGYTNINVSGYMPEGGNNVYLLAEGENIDNEIQKGIIYITVILTETQEIKELIVSSIVNIKENKDNF